MSINIRGSVFAAALLLFAIGIGVWAWQRGRDADTHTTAVASGEREILYWYDPMVPDQHFDRPGKSPFMDMELVPRYAAEGTTEPGTAIAPVTQRSLGIRTVAVERGQLGGEITVPGTIGWDLRLERVVSARADLIIDRLHVKVPFAKVREGEPLASVIAPQWSAALAETQAIEATGAASTPELLSAARARLRALGLPDGARLGGDGRIVLTAPVPGVVSEIGVREGEVAATGTLLFRVNGTRTVWLEAFVPQADTTGIGAGTRIVAEVGGIAARLDGQVESLLPELDPTSRTQRARVVLDNRAGQLSAGQIARVTLRASGGSETAIVPVDAVIGSGDRAHVIVRRGPERFVPVAVRTGRSSGGVTEVLSGLDGGEQVVVSGQFMLDSEASLSGALERLRDAQAQP